MRSQINPSACGGRGTRGYEGEEGGGALKLTELLTPGSYKQRDGEL